MAVVVVTGEASVVGLAVESSDESDDSDESDSLESETHKSPALSGSSGPVAILVRRVVLLLFLSAALGFFVTDFGVKGGRGGDS